MLNSATRRPYVITLYNWLVPPSDWNTITDDLVKCSGSLSLFNRRATLAALQAQDDHLLMTFVVEDQLAVQALKQSGMSFDRFESWRVEQKAFRNDGSEDGDRSCSLPIGIIRDGKFRDHVSLMASIPWIDLWPDTQSASGAVSTASSSMAAGVAGANVKIPVTARVGSDAVVILTHEDSEDWTMIVAHPANDELKTYDLTRERFVEIDEDKAAMLRDEWRDGHRRRGASAEELALSLIAPWTENRLVWPARPRELLRAD